MTQPNPNQHYRLSLNKAIQDYKDGIITATGLVYYAVGIYRAPGQKLRVKDVEAFSSELNIGVSTFYKAVSRLKAKGRMEFEAIAGLDLWIPSSNVVEIQSGKELSPSVESDSTDGESDSTDGESDSTNVESDSTDGESGSTDGELDSTDGENQRLEPSDNNGSGDSPNILSNTFQINSQSTTTTSSAAVVGGKNFSSEKDQDWLTKVKTQLREIRISPDKVSWTFSQFPKAVIEDAIAYTAEQKWAFKPAAVYVTACREGKKPEARSACEDQFSAPPEPDEETLNWLKELKAKRIIKDFYLSPWNNSRYRVLSVDTGASMQPWWEVVEALKAKKQEQDCEKEI